ncbi:MAG: hypothetical protein ACLSHC_03475 [Bilophila wadsworthia]
MVVAAAEAAGAFEFALSTMSTDARLPGREGRPQPAAPVPG